MVRTIRCYNCILFICLFKFAIQVDKKLCHKCVWYLLLFEDLFNEFKIQVNLKTVSSNACIYLFKAIILI